MAAGKIVTDILWPKVKLPTKIESSEELWTAKNSLCYGRAQHNMTCSNTIQGQQKIDTGTQEQESLR